MGAYLSILEFQVYTLLKPYIKNLYLCIYIHFYKILQNFYKMYDQVNA